MEKFIELFASALNIEAKDVTMDSKLSEFSTWDSLGMVMLVTMINQEYDKQISSEEIRKSETIQDLFSLINN